MKKQIYTLLILTVMGLTIISCQKEDLTNENLSSGIESSSLDVKELSPEEQSYISELNTILENVELTRSMNQDPFNPNNPYDVYGEYFESFITGICQKEQTNPSSNQAECLAKGDEYLIQNPYGFSFNGMTISNIAFFGNLADVATKLAFKNNPNAAIIQLKQFENAIQGIVGPSNILSLLTEDERVFLLQFTSMMKYAVYSIEENGVTIGGEPLFVGGPCFDYYFENGAFYVFASLTDTDNPPVMIGAWIGLPGTVVTAILNGLYQAFVHC